MRFTIEYDMEKKEGFMVPGSFEMDEAKGVSDEERLVREGGSLYMEALADSYADYFGKVIASPFLRGDLERVNGVPYYRWVAVDGERRLMEGDRMI